MIAMGIAKHDLQVMNREINDRNSVIVANLSKMNASIMGLQNYLPTLPFITNSLNKEFTEMFKILNKMKAYSNSLGSVIRFYSQQEHEVARAIRKS